MARKAVITGVAHSCRQARPRSGCKRRPVRENDVVSAGGRLQPGSTDAYDVVVANQEGEPVITGTLTFENMQTG